MTTRGLDQGEEETVDEFAEGGQLNVTEKETMDESISGDDQFN